MTVPRFQPDWSLLGNEEAAWIRSWLDAHGEAPVTVEDVWRAMDKVWEEKGCDERAPDPGKLDAFYRHPVWTLNGLFVEQDPVSHGMREAIARWLASYLSPGSKILDFGGGVGTLGRLVRGAVPGSRVDLLDPFPSSGAKAAVASIEGLGFVEGLSEEKAYDAVLCTDVLEHLTDPVAALAEMVMVLRPGGILVVATSFSPVMRCHLPSTFHLRLTFRAFARMAGLVRMGPCPGSHAAAYRRTGSRPMPMVAARVLESASRAAYPLLKGPLDLYHRLRARRPSQVTAN